MGMIIYLAIVIIMNVITNKILEGFVQQMDLQAENQAILQSLDVGIITLNQNGFKFFNQ